jgi:hypothetical protein
LVGVRAGELEEPEWLERRLEEGEDPSESVPECEECAPGEPEEPDCEESMRDKLNELEEISSISSVGKGSHLGGGGVDDRGGGRAKEGTLVGRERVADVGKLDALEVGEGMATVAKDFLGAYVRPHGRQKSRKKPLGR